MRSVFEHLSGARRAATLAIALLVLLAVVSTPAIGAGQSSEPVDLDAVYKIKAEGLNRSEVMEVMSWLTDVYGARLTGSPAMLEAGEWAQGWLAERGITESWLETFPFGRGWTNEKFVAYVTDPKPYPIIGYPKAWTPGTAGLVRGEAVIAIIDDEDDFETWAGKLEGKFVLTMTAPEVVALWDAQAHRYTDEELDAMSELPVRAPSAGGRGGRGNFGATRQFRARRNEFFLTEGVAGLLDPGRGNGGTVFVSSGGSRNADDPAVPAQVSLAAEHYGRIYRTLDKGVPVFIEMEIENEFHDETLDSFNLIAEIPGTDLADEVVMLGGHFDSWHAGTGATDNAAGSAVMMEAMRILEATGLPMRRTVRLGLWGGEEQGLLGSRAYVSDHFADRQLTEIKPDHEKFSAYFNYDNGTGAIRGIYLQGNEAVTPIFEAWMKPLESLGMTTVSIRNTGGTDHLAFDAVGLPGFQFVQDPVEYSTRTHHSSMDVYERIQAEDVMKAAVIAATFVYHTANRDELLPRKPLPQGGGGRGGRGQ